MNLPSGWVSVQAQLAVALEAGEGEEGEVAVVVEDPEGQLQRPQVVWQKPSGVPGTAAEIALHCPSSFCSHRTEFGDCRECAFTVSVQRHIR